MMCTVSSVYGFRNSLRKNEDIIPEHRKNQAHESGSIKRAEICLMHINFTSPQYKNCRIAIILQFLVDFIHLLV